MQNIFVCQMFVCQINAEFKLHQNWIKIDMNINLYFAVLYIFHYLFIFSI